MEELVGWAEMVVLVETQESLIRQRWLQSRRLRLQSRRLRLLRRASLHPFQRLLRHLLPLEGTEEMEATVATAGTEDLVGTEVMAGLVVTEETQDPVVMVETVVMEATVETEEGS